MEVLDQLIGARQLISKPENWCADHFTKDLPDGLAFCARGAIMTAMGGLHTDDLLACKELENEVPADFRRQISGSCTQDVVALYNNAQGHAATLALFDATIARLKREKIVAEMLVKAVETTPKIEIV